MKVSDFLSPFQDTLMKVSLAQRDKEEKLEAAKPVENRPLIPQPRGKYNLQEAMGLEGNKVLYNQCRVRRFMPSNCADNN